MNPQYRRRRAAHAKPIYEGPDGTAVLGSADEAVEEPVPGSARAAVEPKAPASSYAVAAVLDGEEGAWARLAGLTFLRALMVFPGMYVGSKLVARDLKLWQIGILSLTTSTAISGGMLLLYKIQKDTHNPLLTAMDGVR